MLGCTTCRHKFEDLIMDSYNKMRVIGKGSYGEVWLVKHRRDKKQVRKMIHYQNKQGVNNEQMW